MRRLSALLARVFGRRRSPTFAESLDLAFDADLRVTLNVGALERSLRENQPSRVSDVLTK